MKRFILTGVMLVALAAFQPAAAGTTANDTTRWKFFGAVSYVSPLGEDDVTLGRDAANTGVVASDQASRRHARIFVSGGAHVLVDLDSTNGTFLNSKLVKEQTLRHGDVLRIASMVLKYVIES